LPRQSLSCPKCYRKPSRATYCWSTYSDGTAPALHYGEAQGGESRKDFVHKMKAALKELRETFNALRIVQTVKWLSTGKLDQVLNENNQLISIFVRSIETATRNDQRDIGQGTKRRNNVTRREKDEH
jgi:hypothetical protein